MLVTSEMNKKSVEIVTERCPRWGGGGGGGGGGGSIEPLDPPGYGPEAGNRVLYKNRRDFSCILLYKH